MSALRLTGLAAAAIFLAAFCHWSSHAQEPITVLAPTVVDTATSIVVKSKRPKTTGQAKFEGFVMHANVAQITVRAKGNDLAIRTFPLSPAASAKMQQIIDKGGYQYGDKVTVLYDVTNEQAIKVKGKPSKPI